MELLEAVKRGDAERVRELLDRGADPNARDERGWTPLHYAAERGRADVARLLLDEGARVDAEDGEGLTPLHFAAEAGSPEAVKLLVERGADVSARDVHGRTPLRLALSNESCWVLREFISKRVRELSYAKEWKLPEFPPDEREKVRSLEGEIQKLSAALEGEAWRLRKTIVDPLSEAVWEYEYGHLPAAALMTCWVVERAVARLRGLLGAPNDAAVTEELAKALGLRGEERRQLARSYFKTLELARELREEPFSLSGPAYVLELIERAVELAKQLAEVEKRLAGRLASAAPAAPAAGPVRRKRRGLREALELVRDAISAVERGAPGLEDALSALEEAEEILEELARGAA